MKVLILDDEILAVEFMLVQIQWDKLGIDEVLTAYSADTAKDLMKNNEVDLILCDIEMPGEDGISFMHWVRDAGYDSACIFLTCHAKFEYAQEALRLGSDDYCLKPSPYEEMEEKIRRSLEKRKERMMNQKALDVGKQWVSNQKSTIREKYGETRSRARLADEVDAYIMDHLGDPALSSGTIANALCLNADYIGSVYKSEKGTTITKQISKLRMERAALLVQEGEMNLSAISEQLGFENYSYFSSSFKKYFGCSPAQYSKKGSRASH